MELDTKLFYFLNNLTEKSLIFDTIVIFLASYLEYILVVAFLLFLIFSAYSKKEKLLIFFATLSSSIIARLGITEIIRFFYHRPRPFISYQLHPLIAENSWSFPSGHSAFFFAMATFIYLYNKKWGAGFLIAALIMNFSRVMAGVHYPTDIIGGAVIGALSAYTIFYFFRKISL